MASMIFLAWRHKTRFYPLLACRMVKYSLEYGFCKDSISAFVALSTAFVYLSDKIDTDFVEANKWGNFALSLVDYFGAKELLRGVYVNVYALVRLWKELILE